MSPSVKQPLSTSERNKGNIRLAQEAAENEVSSRKKVNALIAPIINYQTNRFCKRFCKENRAIYKCTLNPPIGGSPPVDASLCEWGNGSYAWMLDDLSNSKRLKKYQAKNNATLFDYCYVIANSLPFYERWKDWRFGRKVYVPSYIQAMGKTVVSVYYGMRSQQSIEQISQSTCQSLDETRVFSRNIIQILTKKNRLYLLNASKNISLSPDSENAHASLELETAIYDEAIDKHEDKLRLSKAWKKLTAIEQFVVEALVIEEQDAQIILNTLTKLNISIKQGIPANKTNRQQLYYFRRKALAKLNKYLNA